LRYALVADLYEKIETTSKRLAMTDYLVELLKETPKALIGKVVYLTQGKLYPDFLGIEMGMAERMAIDSIVKATGIEEREVVQSWKKSGDLGLTAEELLREKPPSKEPLTVEEVYETFDRIAHTSGKGSVEVKVDLLTDLLKKASPKEARYLLRVVTGRLRLGVGDMTILDALAVAYAGGKRHRSALEEAYNLSSDLGHVAETLVDKGLEGIRRFEVTVGRPIRPMLAERMPSAEEILERLGGKGAAEFKYDGLRIQAHLSPERVFLFSRRLENITDQFPDVVKVLRGSVKAKEAIVEGECVAVDPQTGDMFPFQMVSRRRGRKYEITRMMEEIPVDIFLFDLLYLDGRDFTKVPYPQRRRELEEIVQEGERVKLAKQFITDNPLELDEYMDTAIEKGCEGLLVKSIDHESIYTAGKRGFKWLKYKREYKSELADTVDLVVVGGFAGRGKRAGTYGALLMAAYNPKKDVFETVCKLGTGFTDQDLARLPKLFGSLKLDHRHPRVESTMEADQWFTPAKVLEVRGAELTLSPSHTCAWNKIKEDAGLAIRFPRLEKWREDKAPEDATTVEEIIEMYHSQLKKI